MQEALLSVRPYIRFLLTAALVHSLTILCKHLYYFQAGGKQSDFLFHSIFHLSVITTVLDTKQAVPDRPKIRESMPLARYPENTRPAWTLGTSRTNPSLSYPRCLGPRPNWDSKPPPLSSGLSAVQGPPPPKRNPDSRSGKSRNPRQESNKSSKRPYPSICSR